MQIWDSNVIVRKSEVYAYPVQVPYHPDKIYPELHVIGQFLDNTNAVYREVRQLLIDARFDNQNIGKPSWNPLGWLVQPGMTVLLKPNFVRHYSDREPDTSGLITHGSVIRAVIDYVYLALRGRGRILIADSPQDDADFEAIKDISGISAIQRHFMDSVRYDIECYDLRQYATIKKNGVAVNKISLFGDPKGYRVIDLGDTSALSEIDHLSKKFYGADFDVAELRSHHRIGTHRYCISQTVLEADVIINLPKMKTHKKCGVTLSMKNLVGINGNKNYLPHYTLGLPLNGGDQFCENSIMNLMENSILSFYKKLFKNRLDLASSLGVPLKSVGKGVFGDTEKGKIRSGNWYGNNTIWRTVLDLNSILLFSDAEGNITDEQQRGYLSIVDGIVGGEGNGPLACKNKPAGFLVMGFNPLHTDIVASYCMGFDPSQMHKFSGALRRNLLHAQAHPELPSFCVFNGSQISCEELAQRYAEPFEPHVGWMIICLSKPKGLAA